MLNFNLYFKTLKFLKVTFAWTATGKVNSHFVTIQCHVTKRPTADEVNKGPKLMKAKNSLTFKHPKVLKKNKTKQKKKNKNKNNKKKKKKKN